MRNCIVVSGRSRNNYGRTVCNSFMTKRGWTNENTAFNSMKTRKTVGGGEGRGTEREREKKGNRWRYFAKFWSRLVELTRRVSDRQVRFQSKRKKKKKKSVDEQASFPLTRLARQFVAAFSTARIFDPQRSRRSTTFNTILLYFTALLSDITDINCHAISLQSRVIRSVSSHYAPNARHTAIIKTARVHEERQIRIDI